MVKVVEIIKKIAESIATINEFSANLSVALTQQSEANQNVLDKVKQTNERIETNEKIMSTLSESPEGISTHTSDIAGVVKNMTQNIFDVQLAASDSSAEVKSIYKSSVDMGMISSNLLKIVNQERELS